MPKTRHDEAAPGQLGSVPPVASVAARLTVITLGDLVTAAYRVAGTAEGTARLLGQQSPLGQLIDRRLVFG